jgi:hypothetical protein
MNSTLLLCSLASTAMLDVLELWRAFSRRIVGWRASNSLRSDLALVGFLQAPLEE